MVAAARGPRAWFVAVCFAAGAAVGSWLGASGAEKEIEAQRQRELDLKARNADLEKALRQTDRELRNR